MSFKMLLSYFLVFILGGFVSFFIGNNETSVTLDRNDSTISNIQGATSIDQNNISYIDSLQRLIAEYKNKLSSLEDSNKELLSELLNSDAKLLHMASKSTVSNKIRNMSDEEVLDKVGHFFKERYLTNVSDYKSFASRLTDIALTDESSASSEATANIDVRISVSMFPGYEEMSGDQVVVSKFRRLYVNMISSYPVPNALIKWKNLSKDKMLLLSGLTFHSNNDSQFVWIKPDDGGWSPGNYQVNIYQINNELSLLASKTYTVTEVLDEGLEPQPEVPSVDGPPLKILRQ